MNFFREDVEVLDDLDLKYRPPLDSTSVADFRVQ